MSTRRFELTDELLRTALASRAIQADDELTSSVIEARVLQAMESTRQNRRWLALPPLAFGRWTPIVVIVLLLAALAVTIAIGSALLPRPDPPFPVHAANGQIVAWRVSGQLQAVRRAGGSEQARLQLPSVAGTTDLAWAPDGRHLAYAAPGGLRIANADSGANVTQDLLFDCGADAEACAVDWAPDGSRIAVAQSDSLYLVTPFGGERATTLASFPGEHVEHPTWAADSSRIAFVVFRPDGRVLYVVNRDGSDLTELYGPSPSGGIGIWDPDWSPDGTQIAYIGSTPTAPPTGGPPGYWQLNVTVIMANGTDPRVILDDVGHCACHGYSPGLAWSPDGTRIALAVPGPVGSAARIQYGGLYLINADGSNPTPLEEAYPPLAWQPVPK